MTSFRARTSPIATMCDFTKQKTPEDPNGPLGALNSDIPKTITDPNQPTTSPHFLFYENQHSNFLFLVSTSKNLFIYFYLYQFLIVRPFLLFIFTSLLGIDCCMVSLRLDDVISAVSDYLICFPLYLNDSNDLQINSLF